MFADMVTRDMFIDKYADTIFPLILRWICNLFDIAGLRDMNDRVKRTYFYD